MRATAWFDRQVKSIDTSGTKVKGALVDGAGTTVHFVLASQVAQLAHDGTLNAGARVKVRATHRAARMGML